MVSLWLTFGLVLTATRPAYGLNLLNPQSLATDVAQTFNISSLPAPCAALCNAVLDSANQCATFSCLCTTEIETNVTGCVNCIVAVNPGEVIIDQAQGIVDEYVSTCIANNVTLVTQTVSGFTFATTSSTSANSNTNLPPTTISNSTTSNTGLASTTISNSTTSNTGLAPTSISNTTSSTSSSTTSTTNSTSGSTTSTTVLPTSTTPTTAAPSPTNSSGAVPDKMDVPRCFFISILAFAIAVLL